MTRKVPNKTMQSGFSVVGVVLIIVVLALVGLGGWYVMNNNQKTKDKTITQQTSTPQQPQQSDPSEKGKYLVIKEWGVKLVNDPTLGTLSYAFETKGEGQPSTVTLKADLSRQLPSSCASAVLNEWKIIRYFPSNPSPVPADETGVGNGVEIKDSKYVPNQSIKQVGNHYYQRIYPGFACENVDTATMQKVDQAFLRVFNSLQ